RDDLVLVNRIDVRPGRKIHIDPDRHRQALRAIHRPMPELRHDLLHRKLLVEIRTADPDAATGQNVFRPVRRFYLVRRDADDREIGRAAADISDENDLLAGDGGFVFEGSGDGLELEFDMFETDFPRRLLQIALCLAIELLRVLDELHRPAEHDLSHLVADLMLGRGFEVAQIHAEDIGKRDLTLLYPRLFVEERPPDHALQRTHEAAILAREIVGYRRAAEGDAAARGIEENRARERTLGMFERRQEMLALSREGDGRVRGSEIDAAIMRGVRHRHRIRHLYPSLRATVLAVKRFDGCVRRRAMSVCPAALRCG